MKHIYIDETIHSDYGFMLLSYVVCNAEPQNEIENILNEHDLIEFHSANKMQHNQCAQAVRSKLIDYINLNCKWGVFLTPESKRHALGIDFSLLASCMKDIFDGEQVKIYLDEGILDMAAIKRIEAQFETVSVEICNSAATAGIQLADLVAALCGVRMRAEISGKNKMLEYGRDAGFDPPILAPVSYELWASLRYSMMRSNVPMGEEDTIEFFMFNALGHGFLNSPDCSKELLEIGEHLFGSVYLGCIH